ncbi:hypothetical protein PUN28_002857 [Cardiocondyla obscurior]|uniref:Uncharacterized protein n=1 Tax=Cardiocondyla obscurior TaxID=286306 RepID=A0AAW2GWC6_9HYME
MCNLTARQKKETFDNDLLQITCIVTTTTFPSSYSIHNLSNVLQHINAKRLYVAHSFLRFYFNFFFFFFKTCASCM